ncbi:MAG: hypothetical protein E7088_05220 [Bacteroidales bacterium]|nr:hypothetical protein [Bacteroidales bacterium]
MYYRTIKKIYKTPVAVLVELEINPIMETGSIIEDDGGEIMDPDDQTAGAHRNDWDNIWEGM